MKRLFIGIPVESEIATRIVKIWGNDPELNQNRLKWVNPENWHITLYFLGDTPRAEIALLQRLIEESFIPIQSFNTKLNGAGVFPHLRNPKVLWLGLENLQPLMTGYIRLGNLLRQNGFAFDDKPLKPHLTVARIKSIEHRISMGSLLTEYRQSDFGSITIDRVMLYESILASSGPVYQPLFVKVLDPGQKKPPDLPVNGSGGLIIVI